MLKFATLKLPTQKALNWKIAQLLIKEILTKLN